MIQIITDFIKLRNVVGILDKQKEIFAPIFWLEMQYVHIFFFYFVSTFYSLKLYLLITEPQKFDIQFLHWQKPTSKKCTSKRIYLQKAPNNPLFWPQNRKERNIVLISAVSGKYRKWSVQPIMFVYIPLIKPVSYYWSTIFVDRACPRATPSTFFRTERFSVMYLHIQGVT